MLCGPLIHISSLNKLTFAETRDFLSTQYATNATFIQSLVLVSLATIVNYEIPICFWIAAINKKLILIPDVCLQVLMRSDNVKNIN